ncbi:MAG: hypothetical protein KDI32_02525 [Pseudomonadales bacterium]|nr:hypothetical protein [Pseudomonadales bacterium]
MKRLAGAAAIWIILALPYNRSLLEAKLVTHQFLQLGGLALAGYLLGSVLRQRCDSIVEPYNYRGVPGLLLTVFALLIWLLPRSLDASLLDSGWEIAKFVTVPLLIGLPLAFSWPHVTVIGRGFVMANFAAMLVTMGVLYRVAPQRLCTNYLIEAQQSFGAYAMAAGVSLAIGCVYYVLAVSRAD